MIQDKIQQIEEVVTESSLWHKITDFLELGFHFGSEKNPIDITIGLVLLVIVIYFITNFIHALGAANNISIFLAALFPVVVSNIIALYLILYKNN